MDKDAPSRGKKRSLFWIVLIVLVIMMGALGWQAKSLLQPHEPAPSPAPVWAKVPPVPPPTTIQIPQPSPDDTVASQNSDGSAPQTDSTAAKAIETTGELNQEAHASGAEPKVTAKLTPDEKALEPTDQAGQTAEAKTPELATQSNATPPSADPITTAKKKPAATPAKAATASKQAATPNTAKKQQAPYTIQVGAFRLKTHAMDTMARLDRKGYKPYLFETTSANKKTWYGVRFGQFETRDQAAQALIEFKAKEKMDGIISRSNSF